MEKGRLRTAQVQHATQHPGLDLLGWVLGVVAEGIAKVERKERSQRNRALLARVKEAIAQEMGRYLELVHCFSLLSQAPDHVAPEYNSRMPALLKRYPLALQRQMIDLFRAHCGAWSICSYCGRLFPGSDDGICSPQCRKGMRNRSDWFRRKSRLHKQRTSTN